MTTQTAFWFGVGEKDRILQSMSKNHSIYLETLRSFAREYCMRHGTVTIDDVRRIVGERGFPMPADIKCKSGDRIFGTVFRCGDFEKAGEMLSTRAERVKRSGPNSSVITVWKLKAKGDSK